MMLLNYARNIFRIISVLQFYVAKFSVILLLRILFNFIYIEILSQNWSHKELTPKTVSCNNFVVLTFQKELVVDDVLPKALREKEMWFPIHCHNIILYFEFLVKRT